MDYLTDPTLIMSILVVTFHFLTAAGFWIYLCRQMSSFDNGKLFLVTCLWEDETFSTLSNFVLLFSRQINPFAP